MNATLTLSDRAVRALAGARRRETLNAFTVDVEDYYQVSAFEKHVPRNEWDRWESRMEANTHRCTTLIDVRNRFATGRMD